MTPATTPTTSVSPTARHLWTRARGLLLAAAVLLVAGIVIAVVRSGEQHGSLDPRSPDRAGSRAIAELLEERGVDVTVVTTTEEAVRATAPGATLLVTRPDLLGDRQLAALRTATSPSGGRTVLLAPGPGAASTLAPGVRAVAAVESATLGPACPAAFARRAGTADLGGIGYATSADPVDACYPSEDLPTLLRVPAEAGGDTVVTGSADFLRNDRLDQHGNASLALQLLGSRGHLVWYLPSPADPAAQDAADESLIGLVPDGWRWGALQLAVAVALAALWRARRLGPLVPERLPVTVPAAEATEGRARLYRQARARDRAADVLRSAARARLAPLLGVPSVQAHSPEHLLAALAAHTGDRHGAEAVLFGPAPADDTALVRLADELDLLERRITPSSTDKDLS
ncbi:DUF4350 domain-containing protein [Streptomyces sp. TRM 70351]|uniref:DUF4350 domain-containing protein n=1 Tax=Streptomyces sp. TRM 70351 TaxID=3116552 RepID=UPI002E7C3594|nr:DUF4350 domain-containing protein [Streptomyces sp. TRM 70351]MEE1928056.1 DUF4350 domain-containing protein [Streptomyces sp. TRM 70351]